MKRLITEKLLAWKNQNNRKPLILRGARQIGKTWAVIDFGKKYFDGKIHIIDLEQHLEWHQIFESNLDTKRILSELEIVLDVQITPVSLRGTLNRLSKKPLICYAWPR